MKKPVLFLFLISALFFCSCEKQSLRPAFSPRTSTAGVATQFESNIQGESFRWNFGDTYDNLENNGTGKTASHTYAFKGNYTVTLRVYNHSQYQDYSAVLHVN